MTQRLDILFVTSITFWGGGEEWLVSMAQGLHARGHRVVFVCQPQAVAASRAADAGLEVITLPIRGELDPRNYARFASLFRRRHFDLALVARSREAKIVGLTSQLVGGPRVVRVYGNMKPIPRGPTYRFTYGKLVPHILAPSQAICDLLRETAPWIPEHALKRLPIGVEPAPGADQSPERVREELGLANGVPLITSIGRLEDVKGHRYLIEALARLRRSTNGVSTARGLLVGEGGLREELNQLAASAGVSDRLAMTGFRRDVGAVLAAADIVALPSLSEGFPLALLEAMMAGRAVVATRVGGIPEMIQDGDTGLLVPPADPGALTSSLAWLIASPSLRARLGAAARARAMKEFHRPRMLDRLETYLDEIHAEGRSAPA